MDARSESLAVKRLRILARVLFFWALLVCLRLFELQILDHEEYGRLAEQQQDREVEISAPRGAIFDRRGEPLAMSVPVDSVCINPMRVPDPVVAAELLSKVLKLDINPLLNRIAAAREGSRGFLWIKRKVTREEAAKLRSYKLDWVEFRTESHREYPRGPVAAHVVGSVNHEERGNGGLELSLNRELEGKPGVMRTTADVRRNVFEREVYTDAAPGKSVTLTIDERIQFVAEKALAEAAVKAHAKTGSVVVMDPKTGDILAMANYPVFNPNEPPKPGEPLSARVNLAISSPFEPGSVFKVFTIATALETTRLQPYHSFFCGNGSMTLFRRVIHDAKPNGTLSIAGILAKSSNIGVIKVALEVGNENLHRYVRAFGFGQRTGIPLPGESSGLVRPTRRWIPSSIGSVAMGHELSATTLQLAQACSVIANGGYLIKPRLILKKQRPGGAVELLAQADPVRVLKPDNVVKMRKMMQGVVLHGTGKLARIPGYSSAGKTGSAQIYDYETKAYTHRYNGSFMGFAPVNNPAVVVIVTLNGTRTGTQGFGGIVAAPAFKTITDAALRFLEVPKDIPNGATYNDEGELQLPDPDLAIAELTTPNPPERDLEGERAVLAALAPQPEEAPGEDAPLPGSAPTRQGPKVPDFRGKTMRTVVQESAALELKLEVFGSGIARAQEPQPGQVLRPGERVKVQFAR